MLCCECEGGGAHGFVGLFCLEAITADTDGLKHQR